MYDSYTMSVPVTTRLDQSTVEAVDRAVASGCAATRGALVSKAVRTWLADHSEEAILASYRQRYSNPETEHDALIADLAAFSAGACLPDQT